MKDAVVSDALLPCPTCGGSGSLEDPNPDFDGDDEDCVEDELLTVACHHCAGEGKLSAQPCPHCGSTDIFVERSDTSSAYVMCNQCGARGPDDTQESGDEETPGGHAAIVAWNRRAPTAEQAEPVATKPDIIHEAIAELERQCSLYLPGGARDIKGVIRDICIPALEALAAGAPNDNLFLRSSPPTLSAAEIAGAVTEALRELEAACDGLAATRSSKTYRSMIDDDKATDALERLHEARRHARAALSASPPSPAEQAQERAEMSDYENPITNYWAAHYVRDGHCSLCGNHGIIDTTGTRTPAGLEVGAWHYCICPNGQVMREQRRSLDATPAEQAPAEVGWIEWHGGECPVPPEVLVYYRMRDSENGEVCGPADAYGLDWQHGTSGIHWNDIVAYRVVQSTPVSSPEVRAGDGWEQDFAAFEGVSAKELAATVARYGKALNSIAHTFTEDSFGGTKTLPAGDYQEMARAALAQPSPPTGREGE